MARMTGYTHSNIKEMEDAAQSFGLSPSLEFRMGRKPLELEQSGVSYLRVAPGFRMPFGHTHGEQEEVYVVVAGSGRLKLDDDVIELGQWDAVRISNDTMRALEGGPDGIELILVGAPATEGQDAKMEQGWWSD
jgi:uncharacterized cupin superfamily protein